jgi:hypothetical protein
MLFCVLVIFYINKFMISFKPQFLLLHPFEIIFIPFSLSFCREDIVEEN